MPEAQVREKKAKLYTDMKITIKNDSKKEIEVHLKGELNVVKVGGNVSGIKSDFFPSELFKLGKIKGVNMVTDSKGGDAPKKKDAPKE